MPSTLLSRLDALPRVALSHTPTPLEAMDIMTGAIGGAHMFVKRDDCTGLAIGGNKVRQLEFYMGDAAKQSADTILITGAVQSNFVRMAAAAARKMGMDIHIQLEERVPINDEAYCQSGNVLLDRLLGATIHTYPKGEDEAGADTNLENIAIDLRSRGRTPYVIHLGLGHPPLGALGYVRAAIEIIEQSQKAGITLDEIVIASGSGHTHAGLLFGLRASGCPTRVTGICVRRHSEAQNPRIVDHCQRISSLLDMPNPIQDSDIITIDDFLQPGYGQLNALTIEALTLSARCEALLLDPVYTGKTMAGMIHRARGLRHEQKILFVHTGGIPALFGYEPILRHVL